MTGIVERNHMFWLENVPLNGTNHVTLQATDAAGNVTVTNFTVKPSSLILTIISTPTGDDLYKPAGSVSGTVGDAGATVTVNGMTATVYPTANADSTYDWSADAVPNNGKGTATFDASAAAANGQAAAVNTSVELGPYWEIVEHKCDKTEIVSASNDDVRSFSTNVWGKHYLTINPPKYVGNLLDYFQGSVNQHYTTYSTNRNGTNYSSWSQFDYGWTYWEAATHATDNYGHDFYDPFINQTCSQITGVPDKNALALATGGGEPPWLYHYFGENLHYQWHQHNPGSGSGYKEVDQVFTLTARTTVKLFTGGKAKVTRQSLFRLACGATKYGQTATGWSDVEMDKLGLRVMGKPVGADGILWVALADNSDADITVVAGANHYNAWATPTKYYLISRCECPRQDPDRTDVGVGEVVALYFSSDALGEHPSVLSAPINWKTTAGSLNLPISACGTYLTSPSNATTATVKATVRGESVSIPFGVVEPTGVDHAETLDRKRYTVGKAGAGMHLRVIMAPTNVSFYRVQCEEVGQSASGKTGYFNAYPPPAHDSAHKANQWFQLNCNNAWPDCYDCYDWATSDEYNSWYDGQYTWVIPAKWKVGDGPEHDFANGWDQKFHLYGNGAMTVTKFGHTVTRYINQEFGTVVPDP